jgi:hypothetical protein
VAHVGEVADSEEEEEEEEEHIATLTYHVARYEAEGRGFSHYIPSYLPFAIPSQCLGQATFLSDYHVVRSSP